MFRSGQFLIIANKQKYCYCVAPGVVAVNWSIGDGDLVNIRLPAEDLTLPRAIMALFSAN